MKKWLAAFALLALTLTACGPSKLQIQELAATCDVTIEVRSILNDSISLMVGNTLYLNPKQTLGEDLYPLEVSVRDPQEIERLTPTIALNSDEELLEFLQKAAPGMMNYGIVVGETAVNEIGFNEGKILKRLMEFFRKTGGGSLAVFYEKGGEIVSGRKVF